MYTVTVVSGTCVFATHKRAILAAILDKHTTYTRTLASREIRRMWIQVRTMDGRKSARVDDSLSKLREPLVEEFGRKSRCTRLW